MREELWNLIKDFKHAKVLYNPNYIKIPVTLISPNQEHAILFNDILALLRSDENMSIIERTASNGFKQGIKNNGPRWDYIFTRFSAEITIIDIRGMWRIQFRNPIYEDEETGEKVSGKKAFLDFLEVLEKFGIDLWSYSIDNGLEVKKGIEKYMIEEENVGFKDLTFNGVHHIDFHSSFAGGLANTHPEFRPALEYLYEGRHRSPKYKHVLNMSIGFMQSKYCKYRFSHLSRDAIKDNNDRVRELKKAVTDSGGVVILSNTDGIWYKGPIYHGPGEGRGLGEWHNDHTNCKFRMKSKGAYEYVENGVYHPVIRGRTKLDSLKDRTLWEWGDIYKNESVVEVFQITEEGIIFNGEVITHGAEKEKKE